MTATDTTQMADLIAAVREHAQANYDKGWDWITEATSDDELAKMIGAVRTPKGAIAKVAKVVALRAEQQRGIDAQVTGKVAQALKDEAATVEPEGTVEDVKAKVKAARPEPKAKVGKDGKLAKAPRVPHACRCGCSRTCLGTFAQGHDARWVSQVRAAILAGTRNEDEALAEVLAVSTKLHDKLRHSLDLHAAAVAKAETAKAEAQAAQTDAKAA